MNSRGIYDGEKSFKIIAFDVTQRYDGVQRFVITDTELGKLGGEVDRVAREKVTMNTIKCTIDLRYCQRVSESGAYDAVTRTKNVIFPSLKKYVPCRTNESLVVGLASADTPVAVRLVDMASSTVGWASGAPRVI
jgi:hypothetical protein